MKTCRFLFLAVCCLRVIFLSSLHAAVKPEQAAATVILDAAGVKNLQIELVEAEERDFEETIFSLGRIRVAPGHRAVVSSRIPGRAIKVAAHIDTLVAKDEELMVIESRQPGDPPPSIRLTAPLGGLISAVNVVPGQPVTPEASLVEILDLSDVHAVAAVPEHLFGFLKPGLKARIRVMALPGRVFDADLAHFGATADGRTGTLEAAFHIENADGLLRPEMRAEFSIVVSKREGVMSIPRAALQGDAVNRFVYVKDYGIPHAFVKSPVQLGARNDEFVEITSGLIPGDEVVTRGAYALSFAGKGSVSLKEALDAAHGHEHNEDGSEVTPGQKAGEHGAHDDHDHDGHGDGLSPLTWFSLGSNAILLLLLAVAMKRRSLGNPEAIVLARADAKKVEASH